jgi:hypothetical protein
MRFPSCLTLSLSAPKPEEARSALERSGFYGWLPPCAAQP